jgi:hypothetical protein
MVNVLGARYAYSDLSLHNCILLKHHMESHKYFCVYNFMSITNEKEIINVIIKTK